jgi:hypothetical protein
MRTTLFIDEVVLAAAKALATRQGKSVGQVVSELARRSLRDTPAPASRNGIPLFPLRKDAKPVTLELVNKLRDEAP